MFQSKNDLLIHLFFINQGKKKITLKETLPSPAAKRVAPIISEDLKKRIQSAIKTKENKGKKMLKKENVADGVRFSFFFFSCTHC